MNTLTKMTSSMESIDMVKFITTTACMATVKAFYLATIGYCKLWPAKGAHRKEYSYKHIYIQVTYISIIIHLIPCIYLH